MLKRLLWTGIYGLATVLLWLLGDYFAGELWRLLFESTRVTVGMGLPYFSSIICAVLAFLALIGKLPHIPEDEPNI